MKVKTRLCVLVLAATLLSPAVGAEAQDAEKPISLKTLGSLFYGGTVGSRRTG